MEPSAHRNTGWMDARRGSVGKTLSSALLAGTLALTLSACGLMHDLFGVGQGNVLDLSVGDCFNFDGLDVVTDVSFVDCSEAHDFEVTKVVELTGGSIPGDDALNARVDLECSQAFEEYTGMDFDLTGDYVYTAFIPSREGWATGDRSIQCLILDPRGKITGTLKHGG